MKNIRRSVFETNSSSMHSLSIIGSSRLTPKKNFPSVINVEYGEFGWGYDRLSDPVEKLSYLITEYSEDKTMIKKIVKIFEDYTGSKVIIEDNGEGDYAKGYIDHQSSGMISELIDDGLSICDLLFDEKYAIIIDNDNH